MLFCVQIYQMPTTYDLFYNRLPFIHGEFDYSMSLLDRINDPSQWKNYDALHAFGARRVLNLSRANRDQINHFLNEKKSWIFGVLSYDLKNVLFDLSSANHDGLFMPDILLFEPETVVTECNGMLRIEANSTIQDLRDLITMAQHSHYETPFSLQLQPRISKQDYFAGFDTIQEQIQWGNIYEINYCQEFYQENIVLQPHELFHRFINAIDSPFMGYLNAQNLHCISASPERFLMKKGNTIISQPIKGTAPRGKDLPDDENQKYALQHSLKDKTENIMIVDLVRNDIGQICLPGSVTVSELAALYTFPNIHQLVSTVEGQLKPNLSFMDIIQATFPMGSMTGAPKLTVLKLIEQVECFKRGWYSGAMGYIDPEGDFDFNVLIRSFLYNTNNNYLSYAVGGGITSFSTAEGEYDECLSKLNSVLDQIN